MAVTQALAALSKLGNLGGGSPAGSPFSAATLATALAALNQTQVAAAAANKPGIKPSLGSVSSSVGGVGVGVGSTSSAPSPTPLANMASMNSIFAMFANAANALKNGWKAPTPVSSFTGAASGATLSGSTLPAPTAFGVTSGTTLAPTVAPTPSLPITSPLPPKLESKPPPTLATLGPSPMVANILAAARAGGTQASLPTVTLNSTSTPTLAYGKLVGDMLPGSSSPGTSAVTALLTPPPIPLLAIDDYDAPTTTGPPPAPVIS
ncbi:hypothetical protein HK104_008112, partial [Borealophlyctis nickersoniae]